MNSTFIVKLFLFSFVNGTYPSYVKVVFFSHYSIRIMALMSDKGKKNPYVLGDHITYIKRTQLSPLFSSWKTTCVLNSWMNPVLWQMLPVMIKARRKVEKNNQSDQFPSEEFVPSSNILRFFLSRNLNPQFPMEHLILQPLDIFCGVLRISHAREIKSLLKIVKIYTTYNILWACACSFARCPNNNGTRTIEILSLSDQALIVNSSEQKFIKLCSVTKVDDR